MDTTLVHSVTQTDDQESHNPEFWEGNVTPSVQATGDSENTMASSVENNSDELQSLKMQVLWKIK